MENLHTEPTTGEQLNEAVRSAAMLVTFRTTGWTAKTKDRAAELAAADRSGASRRAYSTQRNMMFGHDTKLIAIRRAQEAGRKLHLDLTLSWGGDQAEFGQRMLPTASWMRYTKGMAALKSEFNATVAAFLGTYVQDAVNAQAALHVGPTGYPTLEYLAKRFSMRPDFSPVPTGAAFTGLPSGVTSILAQAFEKRLAEKTHAALLAAVTRAEEDITRLADRLEDGSKVFSTVLEHGLSALVYLKEFNVVQDPTVSGIVADFGDLSMISGVNVRKLQSARDGAAERLRAAAIRLNAYITDSNNTLEE